MIREEAGNLLDADVDALVNTVNTVGVMGKGVALQFRQAFPENYKAYRKAVERGEIELGKMFVFDNGQLVRPRFIINFPTKKHWRSKSRVRDIRDGLVDLVEVIRDYKIGSVALPALGCGNGGLDWADVRPMIEDALGSLSDVDVVVFAPAGAPMAAAMRVETKRPRMSPGRAALIGLLHRYSTPDLGASAIEVQKLMYFLQEAGEPLRLNYVRGRYGPYAENLNHVLQGVEGHFLSGYGDRSRSVHDAEPMTLLPGAIEEANSHLDDHPETRERFERVARLVDGFESPYGLELLGTVHWIGCHEEYSVGSNPESAVQQVQTWSRRKKRLFTRRHIVLAWDRLHDEKWLPCERATIAE